MAGMTPAAATAQPAPTLDDCRSCNRPMIRSRKPETTRGRLRHAGLGLCWRCYNQQHRAQGRRVPDEVAIDRAIAGDPPPYLLAAERRVAVRLLTSLELSAAQIAVRLGCSARTVVRHRAAA